MSKQKGPLAPIFQNFLAEPLNSYQENSQNTYKNLNSINFPFNSFNCFPPKFLEDLIKGLNNRIIMNKTKGVIEEEVLPCSIEDINKFISILVIMNLYRFPSYKDHFKLNIQNLYSSPVEGLLGFQRFCMILSNLQLKMSSFSDISKTLLEYFADTIDVCSSPNQEFLIVERKDFPREKYSLLLLYREDWRLINSLMISNTENINETHLCTIFDILKENIKNYLIILLPEVCPLISALKVPNLRFFGKFEYYDEQFRGLPELFNCESDAFNPNYFFHNEFLAMKYVLDANKCEYYYLFINEWDYHQSVYGEDLENMMLITMERINAGRKIFLKFDFLKEFEDKISMKESSLCIFLLERFIENAFLDSDLSNFNDFLHILVKDLVEKNRAPYKARGEDPHFPEKIENKNCKYCIVCYKKFQINRKKGIISKKSKTKYRCIACSASEHKDVCLCLDPCFEKFHENMEFYTKKKISLRRSTGTRYRKLNKNACRKEAAAA